MQIPLYRLRWLCERAVLDGGIATVSVAGKWGNPSFEGTENPIKQTDTVAQPRLFAEQIRRGRLLGSNYKTNSTQIEFQFKKTPLDTHGDIIFKNN